MMKLDRLIADLCPDGVESRYLGDICKKETGKLDANTATGCFHSGHMQL